MFLLLLEVWKLGGLVFLEFVVDCYNVDGVFLMLEMFGD